MPVHGIVEAERLVKEPEEVERIRAAAALVDELYAWLREEGLVGRTERAVAVAVEHRMRELGADALPAGERIAAGTLVTLDVGARLDGYCSDCTRTWATGELPGDLAVAYALVRRAQSEALAAVRPGPEGRAVDAVARAIIDGAGHAEHFGHGLGHGVGLEIHEGPRLSRTRETALAPGHVVTVEPGVYLPPPPKDLVPVG